MATAEGLVSDLFFGFDEQRLALRLDTRGGAFTERITAIDTIRIAFYEPGGYELQITKPASPSPVGVLLHEEKIVADAGFQGAAELVFELTVPFRSLGVAAEDPIQFYVELLQKEQVVERIPPEGAIETAVPGEDFELMNWQA